MDIVKSLLEMTLNLLAFILIVHILASIFEITQIDIVVKRTKQTRTMSAKFGSKDKKADE